MDNLNREHNIENITEDSNSQLKEGLEQLGLDSEKSEAIVDKYNEYTESTNKLATDTEIKTSEAIGKPISPKLYDDHSRSFTQFREALSGNTQRFVAGLVMTLLTQGPSFAKNIDDMDTDLLKDNPIEKVSSINEETDGKTFILDGDPELGPDPLPESEPDRESIEDEIEKENRLVLETNFEMGSGEMSAETIAAFEQEISDFLDSFSEDDLEKIKKGQMVVNIPVGSSHHEIIGVQTTLGQDYTNNYELSVIRGKAMENLVIKLLAERGIMNPITMLDIPNVEGLERGVSENDQRFAGLEVVELTYENISKNYDVLFVDPSRSMDNDREEIEKFKGERADILELKTFEKNGDTRELLFETMKDFLESHNPGIRIAFIMDEGDNSSFTTEEMLTFRKLALERGDEITGILINPDNPTDKLYFDYLNMIHAMKDKGGENGDKMTYELVSKILNLRINKTNV